MNDWNDLLGSVTDDDNYIFDAEVTETVLLLAPEWSRSPSLSIGFRVSHAAGIAGCENDCSNPLDL